VYGALQCSTVQYRAVLYSIALHCSLLCLDALKFIAILSRSGKIRIWIQVLSTALKNVEKCVTVNHYHDTIRYDRLGLCAVLAKGDNQSVEMTVRKEEGGTVEDDSFVKIT
jgi:hypothetical protein